MKRLLPLLLVICMLLCACSANDVQETLPADTSVTEPSKAQDPTMAAPTAPQETEPVQTGEMLYQNPLNGQPASVPATQRPYAVTLNNIREAQPMCSLENVDILFEILAEGGITRCLGIYSDISGLEHIGAIRSARPYLVELAESFDAIYVHHGGSKDGYRKLEELNTDDLDALRNAGSAYYRDQDRLSAGFALEHTSFADGNDLIAAVDELGYEKERTEGIVYNFQFGDAGSTESGESAIQLKAVFGNKTTALTYDGDTSLYSAQQYGSAMKDGNTGKAATFRNVLLLKTESYSYVKDDGVRMSIATIGEGDGFFACDGKVIPIRWSREDVNSSFAFTMEDGTPITLGVGSTYIAVTPLDGKLEYQ